MKSFFFILLINFLFSKSILSDDFPEIFGCFCEGGIITGKIEENHKIQVENENLEIFEEGVFVFAFGRKYKDKVLITYNNISKEFVVKKKKYKIERITGLPRTKVEPNKEDLKKIKIDQKRITTSKKMGVRKKIFKKKFVIPVEGRLTGFFGSQRILNKKPKRPHYGIDIAQKEGSPIVAPAPGIVKLVASNMFFTGNTIVIDYGLGLISIFAHLEKINVFEGEYVNIKEKIGTVGMTGRATGPHLHWGVYLKNTPVDPMTLMNSTFF